MRSLLKEIKQIKNGEKSEIMESQDMLVKNAQDQIENEAELLVNYALEHQKLYDYSACFSSSLADRKPLQ